MVTVKTTKEASRKEVKIPRIIAKPKQTSTLNEFTIIETGGKQYKISPGDVIKIEKLAGDYKKGDIVTLDKVLFLSDGKDITIGDPYIKGATVSAVFEEHQRGKKIDVLKFKSKSRYTKRWGHRQPYAKIKIRPTT